MDAILCKWFLPQFQIHGIYQLEEPRDVHFGLSAASNSPFYLFIHLQQSGSLLKVQGNVQFL